MSAIDQNQDCIICSEPIDFSVLLPCDHCDICLKCFQTLRMCYKKSECPICQEEFTASPIITEKPPPLKYLDEIKDNYIFDKEFKVFYKDPEVLDQLRAFNQYVCPACGEWFTNRKSFGLHLNQHKLILCKTCMKTGRFLNIDAQIFDQKSFQFHLKQHPKCTCCQFQGFDAKELTDHMIDKHYRCDLCANHDKIIWLKDIDAVRDHNLKCHFPCTEDICFETGLIVFDSILELQLHQIQVHGRKIPVSFDHRDAGEEDEVARRRREQRENKERRQALFNRLRSRAHEALGPNGVKAILAMLTDLDERHISPKEFVDHYSRFCGKTTADLLFTDTVALIYSPMLRSQVVRLFEGYKTGAATRNRTMDAEFPSLDAISGPPPPRPAPAPAPAPSHAQEPTPRREVYSRGNRAPPARQQRRQQRPPPKNAWGNVRI